MSIHDAIAILYREHCTVQCSALQLHAQWNDRSYSKHSVITNEFNKQKAAEINRNMKHQTLNTVQHFIMIHLKKRRQKHTHTTKWTEKTGLWMIKRNHMVKVCLLIYRPTPRDRNGKSTIANYVLVGQLCMPFNGLTIDSHVDFLIWRSTQSQYHPTAN